MNYVIPAILLVTLVFAVVKRVSVYDSFLLGAKEAAKLLLTLLPYYVSIFLFIEVFEASGLNGIISKYLGVVFSYIGIPKELSELVVIRPVSGSGGIGILENILQKYGADSYVGRCASVLCGASDTVFYVVAVYTSTCKEKKAPLAIPISLFATMVGNVAGCLLCRLL